MNKPVLIETSARHVHVTQEHLEILFGEGYELTKKKDLSQPGQFACEERIAVIGPKSSFPAVSILGPVRPATQVELSAGDWLRISPAARRQFFASPDEGISYVCIQVRENSLEEYTADDAVVEQ